MYDNCYLIFTGYKKTFQKLPKNHGICLIFGKKLMKCNKLSRHCLYKKNVCLSHSIKTSRIGIKTVLFQILLMNCILIELQFNDFRTLSFRNYVKFYK